METSTRDVNLLVLKLAGQLLQAAEAILEDSPLSTARSRVIGCLSRAASAMTIGDLSRDLAQSRQGTVLLIRRMAADGLVRIEGNPHHRRAFLVELTAQGAQLYEQGRVRQVEFNDRLDAVVSVEQRGSLVKLLSNYSMVIDELRSGILCSPPVTQEVSDRVG